MTSSSGFSALCPATVNGAGFRGAKHYVMRKEGFTAFDYTMIAMFCLIVGTMCFFSGVERPMHEYQIEVVANQFLIYDDGRFVGSITEPGAPLDTLINFDNQ